MIRTAFLALFLASLCCTANAAGSANRLIFPTAGFSIAPLDVSSSQLPQQPLIMALPPSDGFAPNVNVQIQPYDGSLDDYVALSQQQFKSAGLKVIRQSRLGRSAAVFEYSGTMQGKALHWYSRAEHASGKVYLITATATEAQWTADGPRLKSCVDSFQRER